MSLNIEVTDAPTVWVELGPPIAGISVLVEYASPEEGDRFRREMQRKGVLRTSKGGVEDVADGRQEEFYIAFCKRFVKDWRGVKDKATGAEVGYEDDPKNPGYVVIARVMRKVGSALREITEAVGRQELFFGNGDGV
jgi:hypothetical protein